MFLHFLSKDMKVVGTDSLNCYYPYHCKLGKKEEG